MIRRIERLKGKEWDEKRREKRKKKDKERFDWREEEIRKRNWR